MPLIDDVKEQHKFVSDKGLKYKLQYFWDYYRFATIGTILGIIIIVNLVITFVTAKDSALSVMFVNSLQVPEVTEMETYLNLDTKHLKVEYDNTYYLNLEDEGSASNYNSLQKIMAVISAKAGDVMIATKDVTMHFAPNDLFADLRDYFTEDELNALGDKVIYATLTDGDGNEFGEPVPIAIEVSDAPKFNDPQCYVNSVCYSIIGNAPNLDNALKFYDYIYNR